MTLYNLRTHNGDYVITKWDSDMNVESSYTIALGNALSNQPDCTCPQGFKDTCRHRRMLPHFIMSGHIDDEWFYEFDTDSWHTFGPAPQACGNSEGQMSREEQMRYELLLEDAKVRQRGKNLDGTDRRQGVAGEASSYPVPRRRI